jgi:hypothetical protein
MTNTKANPTDTPSNYSLELFALSRLRRRAATRLARSGFDHG